VLSKQEYEATQTSNLGWRVIVLVTGVVVAVGVLLTALHRTTHEVEQILIGLIVPAIISLVGAGLGGFVRRMSRHEAGPITLAFRDAAETTRLTPHGPDPLRAFAGVRARTQQALIQASQDPSLVSPAEYDL
jgi:hypothetical protein